MLLVDVIFNSNLHKLNSNNLNINTMVITIIILAYVVNVFLNRWLNKVIVIRKTGECSPFLWWFSILTTFVLLIEIISTSKFNNWFTGKHW